MKHNATFQKMRRSFTLTSEAFEFLKETRQRLGVDSNSEALEILLREAMLEAKRREIDAACKKYYDTASEQELTEQLEWAKMTGPNIFRGMPKH